MNRKQLKAVSKSELKLVDGVIRINVTIMACLAVCSLLIGTGLMSYALGHLAMVSLFLVDYLILKKTGLSSKGLAGLAVFRMGQMQTTPKSYRKNLRYLNTLYQGMITLPIFSVLVYFILGPWVTCLVSILGMWITFTTPKFVEANSFVKRSNKAFKKCKGKVGFLNRKPAAPDMVTDLKLTFATTLTSELFYGITTFISKQLIMVFDNILYVINRAIKV